MRQGARHIRWRTAEPVNHRSINGWITAGRTESVDQCLSEAEHLRGIQAMLRHTAVSQLPIRVGRAPQLAKQGLNDAGVGCWKGIVRQLRWWHPTHLLTGEGLRLA